MAYRVFSRTWWRKTAKPGWPNGLEPHAGRKTTIHPRVETEDEARDICRTWNANNAPGKLSRKAEYERI